MAQTIPDAVVTEAVDCLQEMHARGNSLGCFPGLDLDAGQWAEVLTRLRGLGVRALRDVGKADLYFELANARA